MLDDRWTVVLAIATASGARLARPVPPSVLVVAALVALAGVVFARRPQVLVLLGLVLASTLSARAWAGLAPPAAAAVDLPVTLVADPTDTPFGVRVDVRLPDGRRVELRATGAPAGTVGRALAGERLRVQGRIGPPPDDAPWLVARHVSGRLSATRIEPVDGGAAPYRAANRLRRLLARGAEVLPQPSRALYGGFVLGDDRDQPPEIVDDFRGAGLTHLLVVSGANVAFLLTVVGPVTRRLGLTGRWLVTLAVIGSFAVVTRFEPSVLRASVMAALAVTTVLVGRPASALRLLALAVTGLLLVDPLLAWSVGFQLSVGASLGIVLAASWIRDRLIGPAWFRDALGVTIAAQLGVVPILVPQFGGLPVVALPANVLAVPVAGAVTTWGLPAGLVAGVVGGPVARVVQWPTRWCIAWVAGVARVAASIPLGQVGTRHLVVAVGAGGMALWWRGRRRSSGPLIGRVAAAVAICALLAPAAALRAPPERVDLGDGGMVVRSGGATVVVLGSTAYPEGLLEALREAGVRRIDVVAWIGDPDPAMLRALRHRWSIGRTVAPGDAPVRWRVGDLVVEAGGSNPPRVTTGPDP